MSSPSKIAKNLVRAVDESGNITEKKVACESFWKNSPCVILFFRRFGCQLCRMSAKELTENVKPLLDEHNIRLIGIGFDSRFVKPFVEEGYFKGELYLDTDMECYKALTFKRYSWFELMGSMISAKWIEIFKKISSKGIKGNFTEGDGFQSGGAIIVDKNGQSLFEFRQDDVSDMIPVDEILKALHLKKD